MGLSWGKLMGRAYDVIRHPGERNSVESRSGRATVIGTKPLLRRATARNDEREGVGVGGTRARRPAGMDARSVALAYIAVTGR
jgi:hypothetical protein